MQSLTTVVLLLYSCDGAVVVPKSIVRALEQDSVGEVQDALARGMSANPALILAAKHGATECMKMLLADADADYQRDEDGSSALMFASQNNHAACVIAGLEAGATPDLQQVDGSAALHYASRHGNDECVRLLLASGADASLRRNNGLTALMIAAAEARTGCLQRELRHSSGYFRFSPFNAPLRLSRISEGNSTYTAYT